MRTEVEKNLARKLKEDGLTYSQISSIMCLSRHSVRGLCVNKQRIHKKKTGPKPKIKKKDVLSIKRKISMYKELHEKVNSTKIIRDCELNVSPNTVQRCLRKLDFKYRKAKSQIVLTTKHKKERMAIITKWVTENHNWETTVFSDEKRFSMDGPDDWRSYVRKSESIIREKRQCKGGGIMVWLMVLPNGLLAHRIISGKFSSSNYITLLSEMIVPIINLNFGKNFWFQEDNSPVHKARIVQKFMEQNEINILKWPAKSPDLNITEDVWKRISDTIYDGNQYHNRADLITAVNNCIYDINSNCRQYIKDLYGSIISRLCNVLMKHGNLYNK